MCASENETSAKRLEYSISEKAPYVVVSFRGIISHVTIPVIEKCHAELFQKTVQYLVLNFQDVTKIENNGIPPLHRLQRAVRDKQGMIRVCSLKKEMRALLLEAGAIRLGEVSDSLANAIQRLHPVKGSG